MAEHELYKIVDKDGEVFNLRDSTKLGKTGDSSNTTSTFTKDSGDTSSITSGSKLSAIFTAISSFFASLKALAFKDKVSDSDINGTISDSHIANASTWNAKYTKPSTGIPKGDLDSSVQESLDKADTAIQGVKVNNTTLTPDANKVVTVPLATKSADGAMSAADKTKLNGIATGAEVNVQSDWDVTDSKSDAFIKNKPYFFKYIDTTRIKFKVCTVPKHFSTSTQAEGIEVVYRRGDGAVHGELLHKAMYELYLKRIGDISVNVNTVKFYYIENPDDSSYVDIYADSGPYCTLTVAPLVNMPKNRVNFTGFGTVVSSLPEGATEITPVWVVNSASSSGTAPVKVDAYGALSAVPMDSTPTASSTNLMTSGAIKTALDGKAASSHTHGNITDDGKIGNTAGLGIVTGTGGTVTAKDFTQASPSTGSDTTTEFISTVAQGSDGAISATKQAITPASTAAAGIVQLSSSTSSSSETMAATPKAVSDLADSLGAGKADKSNITGATKCKITYNSQGIVTAGADLSASDIPNLAASKITSGQFGTDRIADDAITAAKVKNNETLPVNISGTATKATQDSDGNNIKTNYMKASSGNKSLSFGSTTTIGTTNGNNVNLVMPAADSDTFYVSANSTSFSDVLAAYNANKKLILQIGFSLPDTLTAAYNIPLNRIVYSDDTPVIFVWVYTQDSLTGDTNRGVITTWSLGSTGWASEEKYTYFADTAGLSNKASGLMDFGDKNQQKVTRVGWTGSSIGKVIASGNSKSLSESSYLAAYFEDDGIGHVKDVKAANVTVGNATKAATADSAKSVNATVDNSITSTGTNGSMEILNGALSSSGGGGGSCSIDGDGISFTKGTGGSSMTADGISTAGTGNFVGGVEAKGRSIDGSATILTNKSSITWSPSTTNLVVNRSAGSTTTIDLKDLLNGVVYWLHVPRDNIIALKNSSVLSTFYCYDSSLTMNYTTDTYNIRSHIMGGSHGGFSSAIVRSSNNFYVMMDY